MSKQLPESDVRSIVRLLGQTATLGGDHAAMKRFLMNGLCEMIRADAWIWGLMCQPGVQQPQVFVSLLHEGFDEDRLAKFLKALDHPDMSWVAESFFQDMAREKTQVTRRREQILDDETYLATQAYQFWKEADIGPIVMSGRAFPKGAGSTIAMYRRVGEEAFTERESLIAHILLTEIPWLHEMGWPEDRGASVPQLSSQRRILLNLLLDGLDRKTIADKMSISVNTVNGYCKEIYRHFGVSSQTALLARFFRGNGMDQPDS